ncbi:hypothetical protein BS17DRAFT_742164 [Gyrodon lividus]|nr:hypothetical protein BS17DRAFT_742164 [Gyrodon lividus]
MSSYAPANETGTEIWNARSILDGLFLGAIGYGVHMTLFFMCFRLLWAHKKDTKDKLMIVYITIIFVLGNIGNGTNLKFGEMTFIDDRDYPGGPDAFFVQESTNIVAVLCNTVYIVNSWFQDALLLYRFWLIWGRNRYLFVIPGLMFATSFVLSVILIAELSQPGNTIWTRISVNLAIPYWSISIALNVILTLLIAGRLLFMKYRLQNVLGEHTNTPYASLSAMLVESAFLYSTNGLIFIISYGVNSPVQNLALPLLGQTQSIAPLLIILRVAQGKSWSQDNLFVSAAAGSSMRFRRPTTFTSDRGTTTTLALTTMPCTKQSAVFPSDGHLAGDDGPTMSEFFVAKPEATEGDYPRDTYLGA